MIVRQKKTHYVPENNEEGNDIIDPKSDLYHYILKESIICQKEWKHENIELPEDPADVARSIYSPLRSFIREEKEIFVELKVRDQFVSYCSDETEQCISFFGYAQGESEYYFILKHIDKPSDPSTGRPDESEFDFVLKKAIVSRKECSPRKVPF